VIRAVAKLIRADGGADATEYALLASLVAIALIYGAQALGTVLGTTLNGVANQVPAS
jgi:Flp pilus assembly pilin Flp